MEAWNRAGIVHTVEAMKTLFASLLLLAAGSVPLSAQQNASSSGQTTSEQEAPHRFWQCELPTGAYMVALDRICSVGMHEYLMDGGFVVTEVTIDTVGSVVARFYYGEPYRPKSEYATGQAILDRATKTIDEVKDKAQMSQFETLTVKNYPATTHAKTIDFKFNKKENLVALFNSVNKAWITGKGVKFTLKSE